MPIYEYKCSACGAAFEQLIRSSREERQVTCPECGAKKVERQLSKVSIGKSGTKSAPPTGSCDLCRRADGTCPLG